MRPLRNQLIQILEEARKQQRQGPLPTRLAAALVHNFFSLLTDPRSKRIGLRWCLVSQQQLHRHIICIRCPDQAFYLDGIKNYFSRRGIQTLEQQTMVVHIDCDDRGCTLSIRQPDEQSQNNFMFIALHVSATLVPDGKSLSRELGSILQAVDLSVQDFPAMRTSISRYAGLLEKDDPDAARLLNWMNDDKYLYFGLGQEKHRYGLMRNRRVLAKVAKGLAEEIEGVPPAKKPGLEWLYLGSAQNYLYSAASLEVVRISWRSDAGLSSAVLMGHFSRSARYTNASRVPYIRKIWEALQNEPLLKQSAFYRREFRTVFDRMAKPILLTIPVKRFLAPLKEIIDMASPTETKTAIWRPYPGNVSVLLSAIPAARFGPNILANILDGIRSLGPVPLGQESFVIGPHRLLFVTLDGDVDKTLENRLGKLIQKSIIFWKDRAKAIVLQKARGLRVPEMLAEIERLPLLYQDLFAPEQVLDDLMIRDLVRADQRTRVRVQRSEAGLDLYIFSSQELALGRLVAAIQAFGMTALQEAVVTFPGEPPVHLSSLRCGINHAVSQISIGHVSEALEQVLNGEADDDGANALVLRAGLNIMDVGIIITLRNYLIQLLADAAPTPLTQMLNRYPKVSAKLLRLFEAMHRPSMPLSFAPHAMNEFNEAMNEVLSLTDDRWFRALEAIVKAGVRTNAYIRKPGEAISIKIDPTHLGFVPKPVPYREIFVHGTHVEGIHMRAGPVARGGIRFSDRPVDFRTEILELMATQIIKNGQIVPTGAKGGFVVRGGKGEAFVRRQYRIFIRALLELTDNLRNGEVVPPQGIKISAQDKGDPYLVVAADKGTARYSDLANEIAMQTGFWLGDAFASGGKHGYDHKKVGITARGAWLCVREHFALLGIDADKDPISVVGIGDMSGDVFGNGMLLNKNLRLIAAFNHKHIFIDPDPDPRAAYRERKRLFRMEGDWEQYDPAVISQGGGVFLRTSKRIALSPEARLALNIEEKSLSGEELIRAILSAPVDLLYNGGIGTYIRGSHESNNEVRDPANNAVRITARQLRCRVVAEGGNLGLTQKARIEFAARGGRINTDAIDNSAGVDMSDHEVNLKILLASRSPDHMTLNRRNRLLKGLTAVITDQCLANNLAQSRALNLAEMEASVFPPRIQRLRDHLIEVGRIDPQTNPGIEDDETIGLRPQLAVLLGCEKNRIHHTLATDNFASKSCFHEDLLFSYFPRRIQKRYAPAIRSHALADEITHTVAANHLINHFGLGSIHHLESLVDASPSTIAQALLISEFILDGEVLRTSIWQQIVEMEIACKFQRILQDSLIHFAEDLLRLCPIEQLDKGWMLKQRQRFRRYRHAAGRGIPGKTSKDEYMTLLQEARQAGMEEQTAIDMAGMPELSLAGVALHVSSALGLPLASCLQANQICQHLLPFIEVESRLRTPAWGDELAHELRREWLHRLCLLKSHAIRQLLKLPDGLSLESGTGMWGQHRDWESIQTLKQQLISGEEETDRILLLLLLTRMESLVHETKT